MQNSTSSGIVGLGVAYALQLPGTLMWLVRTFTAVSGMFLRTTVGNAAWVMCAAAAFELMNTRGLCCNMEKAVPPYVTCSGEELDAFSITCSRFCSTVVVPRQLETDLVSVERVTEYCDLPAEEDAVDAGAEEPPQAEGGSPGAPVSATAGKGTRSPKPAGPAEDLALSRRVSPMGVSVCVVVVVGILVAVYKPHIHE